MSADPRRDPDIARMLRAAGDAPILPAEEGERLVAAVMAAVRAEVARGAPPVSWWEVAARWLPAAAAAGVAAVLLSGAVILAAGRSGADSAPETAAVAQVLASYPDDSVLATLLAGAAPDDLAPWSEP
jgi:hypothetical protein